MSISIPIVKCGKSGKSQIGRLQVDDFNQLENLQFEIIRLEYQFHWIIITIWIRNDIMRTFICWIECHSIQLFPSVQFSIESFCAFLSACARLSDYNITKYKSFVHIISNDVLSLLSMSKWMNGNGVFAVHFHGSHYSIHL